MCVELLLLAANFNFIAFSRYLGDIKRPGIRVFRADRGRGGIGGSDSPFSWWLFRERRSNQRRRPGLRCEAEPNMNPTLLIAIPCLPLLAAIVAGVGGRVVGRAGAHTVTIAGVPFLSCCRLCAQATPRRSAERNNAPVYTWLISDASIWTSASSSIASAR